MPHRRSTLWLTTIIAGLILNMTAVSHARTHDSAADDKHGFGIELLKPSFDRNESAFTGALFGHYRYPVSERLILLADVPMAYGEFEGDSLNAGAEWSLGNPLIGADFRYSESVWLTGGLRMPLGGNNTATFIGFWSDYNRFKAFADGRWSVSLKARWRKTIWEWTAIEIFGGPVFLIKPGAGTRVESGIVEHNFDPVFDWGVQAWEGGTVRFGAAIFGRTLLRGDASTSLSDRSKAQFQLAGRTSFGRAFPTLYIRIPMEEGLSEITEFAIGLNIMWSLR